MAAVDLEALLDSFEQRLRALGASVADHLALPAPADRVRSACEEFGLQAPDDLITWFGWHDGTDIHGSWQTTETTLIGEWLLLSVEQVVALRRESWPILRETGYDPDGVLDPLFPVLVWQGAPMLGVDCSGDPAAPAPAVIVDPWIADDPAMAPRYSSLADFVATAIRLIDDGHVRLDDYRRPKVIWDDPRTPIDDVNLW